jgi:hypothetical protein
MPEKVNDWYVGIKNFFQMFYQGYAGQSSAFNRACPKLTIKTSEYA